MNEEKKEEELGTLRVNAATPLEERYTEYEFEGKILADFPGAKAGDIIKWETNSNGDVRRYLNGVEIFQKAKPGEPREPSPPLGEG